MLPQLKRLLPLAERQDGLTNQNVASAFNKVCFK